MLRGRAIFVETKTTGERCTEAQIAFHRRLKELGFETYVLDTRILTTTKFLQRLSHLYY